MSYRTMDELNRCLQKAINERDAEKVKRWLSEGATINHTVNKNLDTMLHLAACAGIVYDLIGYSADINARNVQGRTPLHSAAANGSSASVIRALFYHGAIARAEDGMGDTPLNLAVKRPEKKYDVIKELVLHGSVVTNERFSYFNPDHKSALDHAVLLNDIECSRHLMKYAVLVARTPDEHCVNLSAYYRCDSFLDMRGYLRMCCDEIKAMKKETLNVKTKLTLEEFVSNDYICRVSIGDDEEAVNAFMERCLDIVRNIKFPIYNDHIMSKLKIKLEKKNLENKLNVIQVCTNEERGKVVLDRHSAKALARFLPRDDLFNLVVAYYVPSTVPPENYNHMERLRRQILKRLTESPGFSNAKFMKLS